MKTKSFLNGERVRYPKPSFRPGGPGHGIVLLLALFLAAGLNALAQETNSAPTHSSGLAAPLEAPAISGGPLSPEATNAAAVANVDTGGTNGLTLNFRNAPIDLVLQHLSEAAGFIIELDTTVRGTVSVISSHPMTRDEAVDLLNSVLNKNGYAAIRSGEHTLKIMDKATAKSGSNPVKIGNDPNAIPNNDEMVTQIIPIRFVEATQLVTDLSPFVSPQATIIANQAGNSIIITDTQSNIRHLAEIIKAIDSSAEDVTEVRVFHLQYADATETATLLSSLFQDQSNSGAQAPVRFGGRNGRPGFGGPGGFFAAMAAANANTPANSQQERIKKRNQVVAVADARTSSVVVTTTRDLMDQIEAMVRELDHDSPKGQHVAVIPMNNADAQQVLQVLQDIYGGNNSRNNRNSTQTDPFQYRIQQSQNSSSVGTIGGGSGNNRGGSSSRTFGGF